MVLSAVPLASGTVLHLNCRIMDAVEIKKSKNLHYSQNHCIYIDRETFRFFWSQYLFD